MKTDELVIEPICVPDRLYWLCVCACVRVCACVCARACVRVRARVRVCARGLTAPHCALFQADEEGSLWAMDRQTFRRIVLKNAFKKRKMYESLLETVPMLKALEVCMIG